MCASQPPSPPESICLHHYHRTVRCSSLAAAEGCARKNRRHFPPGPRVAERERKVSVVPPVDDDVMLNSTAVVPSLFPPSQSNSAISQANTLPRRAGCQPLDGLDRFPGVGRTVGRGRCTGLGQREGGLRGGLLSQSAVAAEAARRLNFRSRSGYRARSPGWSAG